MEKLNCKVIAAHSISSLNQKIQEAETQGWSVIGSHQAVVSNTINRFAGMQHRDSINEIEYSVTLVKPIL